MLLRPEMQHIMVLTISVNAKLASSVKFSQRLHWLIRQLGVCLLCGHPGEGSYTWRASLAGSLSCSNSGSRTSTTTTSSFSRKGLLNWVNRTWYSNLFILGLEWQHMKKVNSIRISIHQGKAGAHAKVGILWCSQLADSAQIREVCDRHSLTVDLEILSGRVNQSL